MDGLTCSYLVFTLRPACPDASSRTQLVVGLVWWRLLRSESPRSVAQSRCLKPRLVFSLTLALPTTSPVSMARLERILHSRGLRCRAVPSCTLPLCLIAENNSPDLSSEHGLATHYIPSSRVSILLESLAAIENPTYAQVNEAIEDLHHDKELADPVAPLTGAIRVALDSAFSQNTVEDIVTTLENFETSDAGVDVVHWAKNTLATLEERSPTSLKIALMAMRKGASLGLLESLKMELHIATAFCVSFFFSRVTFCMVN